MKKAVDEAIAKYGTDNPPPPAQVYTIDNQPGEGNLHLVQKVFTGAFEVCSALASIDCSLTSDSLISYSLPVLLSGLLLVSNYRV
jgi:mannosyl-oligosaccharide glucosidase